MNNILIKKVIIGFTLLTSSFLIGCKTYLEHGENDIKIVVADSISLIDIDPRETENLHQMVDVLERGSEDTAFMAHIFHPVIVRLDNNEETPFEIKVESFSGDKNNTKVIAKSIDELFETENVKKILKSKKRFFLNFDSKKADITALENYINKAKKDSVYFYDEDFEATSIQVGLKSYKVFNDVDLLRTQIKKALDENAKSSFMIVLGTPLINVPEITVTWVATGNKKCINNVSHYEEQSNSEEVRWVNSGVNCSKVIKPVAHTFVGKKEIVRTAPTTIESNTDLPKPLNTEDVKVENVKDGKVKSVIPNSKKQK